MFRLKRPSWGPCARRRASGGTGTAGVGGASTPGAPSLPGHAPSVGSSHQEGKMAFAGHRHGMSSSRIWLTVV